jgi:hypothetical protein
MFLHGMPEYSNNGIKKIKGVNPGANFIEIYDNLNEVYSMI